MKIILESLFVLIHIFFGIIAIDINSILFGIISMVFLLLALKIADCEIYVVKNEYNKTAKI